MISKLRARRPHHTTVVAYLALFLALTGGVAFAADQITSANVQDESLAGRDIRDRSLQRGDLGVAMATRRQDADRMCGTARDTLATCVTTTINVPRRQRLLLLASAEWESAATDNAEGECVILVDGDGPYGRRTFGEIKTAPSSPFNVSTQDVTGPIAGGRHRVELKCEETNGSMRTVRDAELTVVALGDG